MKTKNSITKSPFIALLGFFVIIGAVVLFLIEKGDFVLFCSENRTPFFNVFFKITTKIVEEKIMFLILAILLWFRFGTAFMTALTWGVGGAIAQSLKRVFAFDRPASFFQETETLNFITSGVSYYFSFPSGHTTAAFAIFSMIAFCSDKKWVHILCFFIALMVGFSRIYLLQHFFMDIYAGAILGTGVSYLLFAGMKKYAIFGFDKWKDKSLRKGFRLG